MSPWWLTEQLLSMIHLRAHVCATLTAHARNMCHLCQYCGAAGHPSGSIRPMHLHLGSSTPEQSCSDTHGTVPSQTPHPSHVLHATTSVNTHTNHRHAFLGYNWTVLNRDQSICYPRYIRALYGTRQKQQTAAHRSVKAGGKSMTGVHAETSGWRCTDDSWCLTDENRPVIACGQPPANCELIGVLANQSCGSWIVTGAQSLERSAHVLHKEPALPTSKDPLRLRVGALRSGEIKASLARDTYCAPL